MRSRGSKPIEGKDQARVIHTSMLWNQREKGPELTLTDAGGNSDSI